MLSAAFLNCNVQANCIYLKNVIINEATLSNVFKSFSLINKICEQVTRLASVERKGLLSEQYSFLQDNIFQHTCHWSQCLKPPGFDSDTQQKLNQPTEHPCVCPLGSWLV